MRDIQTHRHTDTQTETETHRHRHTHTQRETENAELRHKEIIRLRHEKLAEEEALAENEENL
eukprot:COSAG03_NODE_5064_length_1348_cov_13.724580_3_plen_61_part_01